MYLWVKALHIIAVIAWMAGMLYLPRLFVYHAAAGVGSEQSETFKTMEHREALLTVLTARFAERTTAAWLETLRGAIPIAPVRFLSTNGWVPRKSTAALKASA